jgi:enoyl-CoA hydratase/carnithine racemase
MIDLTISGATARITLARPEKLNALTAEMIDALPGICRQIERSQARVAILTGEGKAFCAGGDIEAWAGLSPEDFGRDWLRHGHVAFDALARLSVPLVAVLNGHALGGGLELAACADFRIAETHVKLGLPETGLGIIPGWSGTQRLVRRFGSQTVRRMALAGEVFTAEQALVLGLVDQVVPTLQGQVAGAELAERLQARSSRANELTKMLINAAEDEETGRVLEAMGGALAAASPELAEGLAAFREKRKADFGGKS